MPRPAGGPILKFSRLESGRNAAQKTDFRTGSTIEYPRVTSSRMQFVWCHRWPQALYMNLVVRTLGTILCYAIVLFLAGNRASGQDFGRILIGRASKSALRQAFSRPEGRFLCFPDRNPAEIRPGSPISDPEALLRNIGQDLYFIFAPPTPQITRCQRLGLRFGLRG